MGHARLAVLVALLPYLCSSLRTYRRDDTLAVFVLNTYLDPHDFREVAMNLDNNIAPYTPTHIHVVTRGGSCFSRAQSYADNIQLTHALLHLHTVDQTGYGAVERAANFTHSFYKGWYNMDYRLMGDWRLWHMQQFAKSLGYHYVLQIDLESRVTSPIDYNIVERFRAQGYKIGYREERDEAITIYWGLAELIRFFLLLESYVPEGPLFSQCNPNSILGLRTFLNGNDVYMEPEQKAAAAAMGLPAEGGWRMTVPYGNFVVLDLDFWLSDKVSHFIALCRLSTASVRLRWNEQSVYGAVMNIFIPVQQRHYFNFSYIHG